MTEVVDLTFTDSDDEPQPKPSQPDHAAPTAGAAGMRTPLRRLLALQRRNDSTLGDPERSPYPPLSPEEIDLLESPEPPKKKVYRNEFHKPTQGQVEGEKEEAPAAAAADAARQNVAGPSRPLRANTKSQTYNPSEYEDQFAEEGCEPEYLSQKSPTTAAAEAAAKKEKAPGGRKPKRSREEIARDKELKKQQK